MAFQAKDGSKHTNRDTMRTADARHMAKSPQARPNPADEDQAEAGEGAEPEQDGAALAQQHGPAVQIDIQHDHQGGRHSVHAMHPDGHEHESEHATPDDAHRFAAQVAGVGGEAPEGAE